MRIKTLLTVLFAAVLMSGLATITNAQTVPDQNQKLVELPKIDDDGEDQDSPEVQATLKKQAKISIEQARKIALEQTGGTIIDEGLEKENGKLVYSFEIRQPDGKLFDIEVDAKTGAIANVEAEEIEAENEDNDEGDNDAKKTPENPPLAN